MRKLIGELRRRNVFKVGVAYVVVAWALMQGADVVFPALNLPAWTVTLAAVLLIAGFPVALLLAWAFELTPSGFSRERTADAPARGVAAAAAGASATASPERPSTATAPASGPDGDHRRSLAVLPFVDLSPGHDHEYFVDGLAEELLNALARVKDLRVPSRTSCFAFRGTGVDVGAVASRLRVSHVLEGSVRRSRDRVRVTAKLIDTASDSHVWSETYDRTLDDILEIQTDIGRQIVAALQLRLRPGDAVDATTRDPIAYESYLTGRGLLHRFGPRSLRAAVEAFTRATEIDAGFARAWAGRSEAHAALATYHSGGAPSIAASDAASRRAVELAPHLAEARTARAVAYSAQQRYAEAAAEFERAVELDPDSFDAWYQYARTSLHRGDLPRAVALFERAMQTDPDDFQSPLLAAPVYRKLGDESRRWPPSGAAARSRRVTSRCTPTTHAPTPRDRGAVQPRRTRDGVRVGRQGDRDRSAGQRHALQRGLLLRAGGRGRSGLRVPAGHAHVAVVGRERSRARSHPRRSPVRRFPRDAAVVTAATRARPPRGLDEYR